MGDHIICNGIIRSYAEKYERVFLFVKPRNILNVQHMYRDLSNVRYISLEDLEIHNFIKFSPQNNYLIVGHEKLHEQLKKSRSLTFDEIFYNMAEIPFEDKWNKFHLPRDLQREKDTFFNKLRLKDGEPYIFLHEDPNRNYFLNRKLIPKNIKIIKPSDYKDISLFDFVYTIENCQELHLMDSSFSCLVDTMQIKKDNIFIHLYVRKDNSPAPKLRLNWIKYT